MKAISSSLSAHLAQEVTTLATCWKLTRRDGTVLGFTDHDRDIAYDGVTYQASGGFTPTAVSGSADLAVDDLEVDGILDGAAIAEADIRAGVYDFAAIELFLLNYAGTGQGALSLRHGTLGEVRLRQGRFEAEVRGLTQHLSQRIGELYSPACRAAFGDARCGVNLAVWTHTGSITSLPTGHAHRRFEDTTRTEEDGYFTFGTVTFTGGLNDGLSMEVKRYVTGEVELALPLPYAPSTGDPYTIVAGCDKTFPTCAARFSNALNFRGEPHVPGLDRILETAGTRSG